MQGGMYPSERGVVPVQLPGLPAIEKRRHVVVDAG
jgi:hypothetical protein